MTLKYCKCGAVVNESYSEFINFEKWTCDCEITNAKKQKKLTQNKKHMKYLKIFIIGIINGAILNLIDLSFWSEIGIYASVIAIIMIIFRNKL